MWHNSFSVIVLLDYYMRWYSEDLRTRKFFAKLQFLSSSAFQLFTSLLFSCFSLQVLTFFSFLFSNFYIFHTWLWLVFDSMYFSMNEFEISFEVCKTNLYLFPLFKIQIQMFIHQCICYILTIYCFDYIISKFYILPGI